MLADELIDADATGARRELVHQLSEVDLLILEDFGMKTLRASAAEDLLDIIMRRHERRSTIITTNRPTENWAKFLGDVPAATAILDRFLQHVEILIMEGAATVSIRAGSGRLTRAMRRRSRSPWHPKRAPARGMSLSDRL